MPLMESPAAIKMHENSLLDTGEPDRWSRDTQEKPDGLGLSPGLLEKIHLGLSIELVLRETT